MPDSHPVVVFDGFCCLCSRVVKYIGKYDRDNKIRCAPRQSQAGRRLLERYTIDPGSAETVVFIKEGEAFSKSDAVLEIARDLKYWRWLRIFKVIPIRWRDAFYDFFARHRYAWFGKKKSCHLPESEERFRFIDEVE